MLWCFGGSWVCFMLQTLLDVFFGLDSSMVWIYCSLRYQSTGVFLSSWISVLYQPTVREVCSGAIPGRYP